MRDWHSLKAHNSLRLDAKAQKLRMLSDLDAINAWLDDAERNDDLTLALGGGSNVVFTKDFPGSVGIVALSGIRHLSSDANFHYIEAGAGVIWHDLVQWTLAQGFAGLENLSLIPGTVGAAPMQNIGAYGVDLEQRMESLQAIESSNRRVQTFAREDCGFAYRDSRFKQAPDRWLITQVIFKLPRRWQPVLDYAGLRKALPSAEPNAREISDTVCRIRQSKLPDPDKTPNVGSFFKNPIVSQETLGCLMQDHPKLPSWPADNGHKLSAGWLIEQCGWKGKRRGAVGVYDQHALVLVNHRGASGNEILKLANDIQDSVAQRFGIALEPEPRII